jgi:hypothetical protein
VSTVALYLVAAWLSAGFDTMPKISANTIKTLKKPFIKLPRLFNIIITRLFYYKSLEKEMSF